MVISCARNPYAATNKLYKKNAKLLSKELEMIPPAAWNLPDTLPIAQPWVGTTNFNLRKPNLVIIHHTAQDSVEQTLHTFTLPRTEVSAHYVIAKNGKIYHMLNDLYRAWHGGNSRWGANTDLNSCSIGIELDNNGFEEFSSAQIESLLSLLTNLKARYKIPDANFIGHSDIAPTRKNDPNQTFPWKQLAEEGFGLWYDEIPVAQIRPISNELNVDLEISSDSIFSSNPTSHNTETEKESLLDVPIDIALRIIGYDVSDLPSAIKAFKLHFIQTEVDTTLTDYDLRVLNNLYKKYL